MTTTGAARLTRRPRVTLLDYGSGNLHSAARALTAVGADVTVTADETTALDADGLVVPGVGAFAACMAGLRGVDGPRIVDVRLAGARPVLGICVGMQVMFEVGDEFAEEVPGFGEWPGRVERLTADVLPHMGWNTVTPPPESRLFDGIADQRFYFVHSFAARELSYPDSPMAPPLVTTCDYGGGFVAAVENGPLSATQFHPEKSGDAGLALLRNWLDTLR
ncbi:MAG: imidazole glycerol phosphate synthase subunit HisH [Actinobacteria bacterium]|nr:imidazole glycerol phosphate synthase subunit HisH [Actinomycetota bacterium]MCB9412218.1 imidazole glycerol phosphate synthase subunit HisH [Actinomycetota bacterium]